MFFFPRFFLIIDLYLLIPTVIGEILNHTAKLAIPTRTPTNAEIEIQPLTAETKKIISSK